VDPIAFSNAVAKTIVRSDEHAFLGGTLFSEGQEVDAVNFPDEGRILVNRSRWIRSTDEQKLFLTMHEYLGILGMSDRDYQISGPFLREHGKIILAAGTPVSVCHALARLTLVDESQNKTVSGISIDTLLYNSRPSSSQPPFASPTFWIDFYNAATIPRSIMGKTQIDGDSELLKKALGKYISNGVSRPVVSGVFGVDDAKRINLFVITSPNFTSLERYGSLDRIVKTPIVDEVCLESGSSCYQIRQTVELHCEK
jgi:hypothetical protein